jgi:hypothetical protein
MKTILVCLALAALPALGQPPAPRVAPIALYTQFQKEHPPEVEDALRKELSAIMSPIGLQFEWRSLPAQPNEVANELAVITFNGKCDVRTLTLKAYESGRLGWTHVSEGVVLPFSDIDCDAIREFLQSGLAPLHTAERQEVFGKAVARVLAHELYHVFAKTQRHSAHGVSKARYSTYELLSNHFEFDRNEAEALREGRVFVMANAN